LFRAQTVVLIQKQATIPVVLVQTTLAATELVTQQLLAELSVVTEKKPLLRMLVIFVALTNSDNRKVNAILIIVVAVKLYLE